MNPLFGQISKKSKRTFFQFLCLRMSRYVCVIIFFILIIYETFIFICFNIIDAAFESARWSSNQERTDRPNKRIHSGLNADSQSEHKRLKCGNSTFERVNFDGTLLTKQQRPSTTSYKKSPQPSLDNTCNSQLLRRLVSPQIPCIVSSHTTSLSNDGSDEHCRGDISKQRARILNDIIDLVETEDDHGGGGGGGNRVGDDLDRIGTTSRNQNPTCGGSSVLMNLLVSGCDVSAGYVCLMKPKPMARSIANA